MRFINVLFIVLVISFTSRSNIVYFDNNDAVYPYPTANTFYDLDINSDGENDVQLRMLVGTSNSTCGSTTGLARTVSFLGMSNAFGANRVNAPFLATSVGYDCTGDTLNSFDEWNSSSLLYRGFYPQSNLCQDIGVGNHKQGVRLIKDMTGGGSGYLFGYIDYSITPSGDVIIHGWFYESTFNVPIVANTLLDYPYDANCIYYDTVTVYDTVAIYDTTFTTVTDTLYININDANLQTVTISTLKVFPNPANDHITIDNGSFANLSNYELRIVNTLSQTVWESQITQQSYYIDITSWSGAGIYYLTVYDPFGVPITTRKIVLD